MIVDTGGAVRSPTMAIAAPLEVQSLSAEAGDLPDASTSDDADHAAIIAEGGTVEPSATP